MSLRYYFLLLIFIFSYNTVTGQDNNFSLPKVLMPEPSAAEFIRQEAFPVSNFTGTANVTVPIYTVESGDIKFPITASYLTRGIKVDQEASWIGLGWSLNTGGMITRVINGTDDLGENDGTGRLYLDQFPNSTAFEPYINNTCVIGSEVGREILDYIIRADSGLADLQPDYFYFNFGNHSGKFVLPSYSRINEWTIDEENYKPLIFGNSNVDIKLIRENTQNGVRKFRFVITDPNGTKYYFGTSEKSISNSYEHSSASSSVSFWKEELIDGLQWGIKNFETSTWHLDSIISVKNNKVNFEYSEPAYMDSRTSSSFNLLRGYSFEGNGLIYSKSSRVSSGSIKEIKTLKKINFKNGSLDFITEYRSDVESNDFLTNSETPQCLTKIEVKNTINNNIIKEINFIQGYFNFPDQEGHGLNLNSDLARLKLDSITILDKSQKNTQKYGFDYYSGTLPSKESFGQDYWGYYNGRNNNQTLIPKNGFEGENYNILNGATRDPKINFSKIASLKSVSYPTKGTTTFEYGANVIEYENMLVPSGYTSSTLVDLDSSVNEKAYAFYVSQDSISVNWYVSLYYNGEISGCQNSGLDDDDYIDECCSQVFSGVIREPEDILFMDNLYNGTQPTEDLLLEIPDSSTEEIKGLYLDLANGGTEVVFDQLPSNMSSFTCSRDPILSNQPLKLYKGWYVFYASKPEAFHTNTVGMEALLSHPEGYEMGVVKKYGPGLRIDRQILDSGIKQEVTNYKYETGFYDDDSLESDSRPVGDLISKPEFRTSYNIFTMTDPQGNKTLDLLNTNDLSIIETSSNNISNSGSFENLSFVGYRKVTVSKNDNLNNGKSIFYYDRASLPPNIISLSEYSSIPIVIPVENGRLLKEEFYDKNNVQKTAKYYYYKNVNRGSILGVRFFNETSLSHKFYSDETDIFTFINPEVDESCGTNSFTRGNINGGDAAGWYNITTDSYYLKRYTLNSTASLIEKTIEIPFSNFENNNMAIVTEHEYNNDYLLPVKTSTYLLNNFMPGLLNSNVQYQKNITFNKYPFMYDLNDANDPVSKMAERENYQIGSPIEVQNWKQTLDGSFKLIGGQFTSYDYNLLPNKIYSIRPKEFLVAPTLPNIEDVSSKKFDNDWVYNEEIEIKYDHRFLDYDASMNIVETSKSNGLKTKFYWGYNNAYPVIKVDNTEEVLDFIADFTAISNPNHSNLDSLLYSLDNIANDISQQQEWQQYNIALRNELPESMITTYTFDPLTGVTSVTDPKGYIMYYEYDDFNRLKQVKDADGNILSKNEYNYKP